MPEKTSHERFAPKEVLLEDWSPMTPVLSALRPRLTLWLALAESEGR